MNSDLVRFSKPPTGNFEFISDGLNVFMLLATHLLDLRIIQYIVRARYSVR